MNTNEETKYKSQSEEIQNGGETVENKKQDTWKAVSIGGVSGILMGAGALYAVDAFANSGDSEASAGAGSVRTNPETGIRIAEVSDDMSFGEAFAAAREAAGPGAVFHWHGNVYNTYYANEWNNMSPADRNAFAQAVKPEIGAQTADASGQSHHVDVTVNVNDHTNHGGANRQENHNHSDELEVAQNVNDDMTFNQAFAAARAEVGPGGVFHWHGRVYNTYYKDEWANMSRAEKNEFAELVKPELTEHDLNENHLMAERDSNHDSHEDPDVREVEDAENIHQASNGTTEDSDVRLIAQSEVEGHQVDIYDTNGDDEADIAVIDVDDTGDLTPPDRVINSEGDVYSGDGTLIGNMNEMGSTDQENLHLASNDNPEVAPDMPDYMPNADMSVC